MKRFLFRVMGFLSMMAATVPVLSQQPIWQPFGTEQGLPDATITCLHRTKGGILCAGTHNGVLLISGNHIDRITTADDPSSQVNPFINCIQSDKRGNLLVGSRNAFWLYDPAKRILSTLIHPYATVGGIQHIAFTQDSTLVLAATHGGILKIDISRGTLNLVDSIPNLGANKSYLIQGRWYFYDKFRKIQQLQEGRPQLVFNPERNLDAVWLEKFNSWYFLTPQGFIRTRLDGTIVNKVNIPLFTNELPELGFIYLDQNSNLFVKLKNGLLQVDPQTLQPRSWLKTGEETEGNQSPAYYYEDTFSTQWLATLNSGIRYFTASQNDLLFLSTASLGCQTAWSFYFDPEKERLWIGTDQGVIVGTFEESTFRNPQKIVPKGSINFAVTKIIPINQHALLLCTFGHGLWSINRDGTGLKPMTTLNQRFKSKNIYGATFLKEDRCLVYSQRELMVCSLKKGSAQPILPERSDGHFNLVALLSKGGDTYVANGVGLLRMDEQGNLLSNLINNPKDSTTLSSPVIVSLLESSRKIIYVGTMGGGLCSYHPETGMIKRIRLVANPVNIFGIAELDTNHLLLTTSEGMVLYTIQEKSSSLLNKQNLLPFNDFNQFGLFDSPEYLFASGEKGVIILNRKKAVALFTSNEKIVVRQNGQIVDKLDVEAGKSMLEFQLTLFNFLPNKKMEMYYQLEVFEKSEHLLKPGQEDVVYNYLPPGDYKLVVRAFDKNNHYFAEPISLAVHVLPLYYQTWWFKVIMGIVSMVLLILTVRYFSQIRLKWRLKKLEEEQWLAKERARISRELHDNVGSQLTYLISGLESSEYLLKKDQPDKVAGNLQTLQQSARESMQQLRQAIWALDRDEIHLSDFLQQFNSWFAKIMEFNPEIRPEFTSKLGADPLLDPLQCLNIFRMMQETVHNAIKHAGPCTLKVQVESTDKQIRIEVSDGGKGFTFGENEGTGMNSLRHRAEELGATIKVSSHIGKGTKIDMKFDLK